MAHFILPDGGKLELNLYESLEISKEKVIGNGVYQVVVHHMDKPENKVVCRIKAGCSNFDFLWSSTKISQEAQDAICNRMAARFWD